MQVLRFLKNPIDYDSIDGEPVKMVFLLAGPESKNSTHIKLLSRISRLMNSTAFREALAGCETSDEIYKAFLSEEERYFGN
jgi:mannitol/fructose-specific phosphotransferase system IIA component (Ntr-type)